MPEESEQPGGVRLGPVTWVPGLRSKPNDPWAHRKGEPRPLALVWSVYLMVSALLTLLQVRSLTMPKVKQFGEGCRGMVLMTLLGASVLWPMVRLSQERPVRIGRSLAGDLVVILTPVQAVIWPMPILTHWSIEVTGALASSAASWALLSAGVLAGAYRSADGRYRWLWMAGLVLMVSAAPVLWAALGVSSGAWIGSLRLLSPLTAAWGITSSPSGLWPVMQRAEWLLVAVPGVIGAVLWLVSRRFASDAGSGYSSARPTMDE